MKNTIKGGDAFNWTRTSMNKETYTKSVIRKTFMLLTEISSELMDKTEYIQQSIDESFHQAFARYIDGIGSAITKEEIEEITGVSKASLYRYISLKDETLPDTDTLISLCVGLRLYYPRIEYLFSLAGKQLTAHSQKYRICKRYMLGCFYNMNMTVEALNEELISHGLVPLRKEK